MADFTRQGCWPPCIGWEAAPRGPSRRICANSPRFSPSPWFWPALYPEFEGPAIPQIIQEVSRVPYLNQVVVTLSGADAQQFDEVKRRVAGIHPPYPRTPGTTARAFRKSTGTWRRWPLGGR